MTIAQVLLLREAAEVNRQKEQLDLAQAVAWGIAEALNPQAQLLVKLRAAQVPKETAGAEPAEPDPQAVASLFGVPLME